MPSDPSDSRPPGCLAAILDSIEDVENYVAGLEREAFEEDELVRDAVERCLERVCEGVDRLGESASALMPHQPWDGFRDLGNTLRRACERVSVHVIWMAIVQDVPKLKLAAALALDRLDGGQDNG